MFLHDMQYVLHEGKIVTMKTTPQTEFQTRFRVEFGDCDPAGIVFYPRYLAWFDACFQQWLSSWNMDQAQIQNHFNAVGTGLMKVEANFRAPARPGDSLTLSLTEIVWNDRTLQIHYRGTLDDQLIVEGYELRGLLGKGEDGALKLMPLAELRAMIGQ
jgi:4-hydroxybenzoyl-CoA thioesterase